jgi:hypothetical protein
LKLQRVFILTKKGDISRFRFFLKFFYLKISEGLEEMFEGDSADKFAGKFLLVSMGGGAEGLASQIRERGPPSALVEFVCCLVLSPYLELLINVSLRKCTAQMNNTYCIVLKYNTKSWDCIGIG